MEMLWNTGPISADIYPEVSRIVAVMSMGIVVPGRRPASQTSATDPAVVVVTPDFSYVVPVLGGHHGANELAKELAGLGLVPVISTATEATGRDSVEGIATRTGSDIVNRDSTRAVNAGILDGTTKVYAVPGPGIVLTGRISRSLSQGRVTRLASAPERGHPRGGSPGTGRGAR